MLDFIKIAARPMRNGGIEYYPKFLVKRSKDLMIKGQRFYSIYDEKTNLWSEDENDVQRIIDGLIRDAANEAKNKTDDAVHCALLEDYSTKLWKEWKSYSTSLTDNYVDLNSTIQFSNMPCKREDYASETLPYPIEDGPTPAWDEICNTLYEPEEREKFEWSIGAIISGASTKLQKFLVFKGPPGSGKSTILDVISGMFKPYVATFDAKALGNSNKDFSLEAFKNNPLVAIQHDGDLSKIEDNTKLNSIVSHEYIMVNEKFKSQYPMKFKAFLMMGTNEDVMITSSNSGITRRLIDVYPSERHIEFNRYNVLIEQVKFEYGAIAYHCLDVFKKLGKSYYNSYRPKKMIRATNEFFNYIEDNLDLFLDNDFVTLKTAWTRYNQYVEEARVMFPFARKKFKSELQTYFNDFKDQYEKNGEVYSSVFIGFKKEKFGFGSKEENISKEAPKYTYETLGLRVGESPFDRLAANWKAQYGTQDEKPKAAWDNVATKTKDLNTRKLHYILLEDPQLIVVDFDLRDENGNKSLEKNIEAASKFPPTYTELSKSGAGVHLHYIYTGNVDDLSVLYDEGIEIKVFKGKASLRRKLTYCNDLSVATISSGLPLKDRGGKEESHVILKEIQDLDKYLYNFTIRAINKEHHGATHPEVQLIKKVFDDAYKSGKTYDVHQLYSLVMSFAAKSTNHATEDCKIIDGIHFMSKDIEEQIEQHQKEQRNGPVDENAPIVFFDWEVFKNVSMCCWKIRGSKERHKLINPKPEELEKLLAYRLIGFNNLSYDNNIMYAAMLGYSNKQLYDLSVAITSNEKNVVFAEARNLSYTDIYDYCSKKQSLKKWEIELEIRHLENSYPWDEPLPEEHWDEVAEYCCNDVDATEAVFEHTQGDFTARLILAEMAHGTPNMTTNQLTQAFIFGKDKKPALVYTDLETGKYTDEGVGLEWKYPNAFPGYSFENGKNMFRGTDVGKGGLVMATPGAYKRTITLDVASMHPSSLIALNLFGKYTERFKSILDGRIAIKHKDYDAAVEALGPECEKYLKDPAMAKALAQALKIAINSVYGLTSASFPNRCRDPRNVNNIVALRGALFMRTLYDEVTSRGFTVVHIKTDSIKIAEPSKEILDFCIEFGHKYGYNFEIEHVFDRICLVNDAVYIAELAESDEDWIGECKDAERNGKPAPTRWTATGTQFAIPYVFKTLFSKEPIIFEDMCETKSVQTSMWLDFNENLEDEHDYRFVGRVGSFTPVKDGCNGGLLMRKSTEGKYASVTGTKGYRWMESELVRNHQDYIDDSYFRVLVDKAVDAIEQFIPFNVFTE